MLSHLLHMYVHIYIYVCVSDTHIHMYLGLLENSGSPFLHNAGETETSVTVSGVLLHSTQCMM